MTDQHYPPITPPPELVAQWRKSGPADAAVNNAYEQHIATQAARWGADIELEACCEWLQAKGWILPIFSPELRATRRPKPLKEQCIALIDKIQGNREMWQTDDLDIVRRAIESLPN